MNASNVLRSTPRRPFRSVAHVSLSLTLLLFFLSADVSARSAQESAQIKQIALQMERSYGPSVASLTGNDALRSPVVGSADLIAILNEVPPECAAHLRDETEKFQKATYAPDSWAHHVAHCNCCGPTLRSMFATHVHNVSQLPHMVIFFDFDGSSVSRQHHTELRDFIHWNKADDKRFLLVGRASRTVKAGNTFEYIVRHRTYNNQLAERRIRSVQELIAHEILGSNPNPLEVENRIPRRNFGLSDPQILPAYASQYNFPSASWKLRSFPGKDEDGFYRMNQSVVVVAFKPSDHEHEDVTMSDVSATRR